MKTIVRRPVERRSRSASAITSRISLMPASTALNDTNRALVVSAMMRASVVFPVPGGPQRMIDCRRSRSIASRSGRPGASSSSWPTNSSNVRGRMRSASGAVACARRRVFVGKQRIHGLVQTMRAVFRSVRLRRSARTSQPRRPAHAVTARRALRSSADSAPNVVLYVPGRSGALAPRFVDQNRGRDGGVQRFDRRPHRNADADVRLPQ